MTSQNEVQKSPVTETYNDPFEESKPPRKKQKRGNEPRSRSLRQPQRKDGLINARDGSLEEIAKAIESNIESGSGSDSEPEVLAQLMVPVQRLSTFDTSKSKVLSETETEWTVRLHPNDVSKRTGPFPTIRCRSEIYQESSNIRPV